MKAKNWRFILAIALVALSAILYTIHFFIFRDAHHIFIYLLGDIAFTPIEVLIVTLIIHRLLTDREKKAMLKKLNMVIGAFFSEVGLKLVYISAEFDVKSGFLKQELSNIKNWDDKDFIKASKRIEEYDHKIESTKGNLKELKLFLTKRRDFLLRLLENPNLLEHEKFTELLWAVFHLTEELEYREDLENLPESDYEHISGDISRVYLLLIAGWLDYIKHLKERYPYLFSLAARVNPFDKQASPIVT
ncbi:MAG: hypothetical protein R6U35_01050 [Candidatus Humimicrobiaceae bacterium]